MENSKLIVSRPIGGVSLNGKEYLLDDEGEVRKFDNEDQILSLIGVRSVEELEDNGMFIEYDEEEE